MRLIVKNWKPIPGRITHVVPPEMNQWCPGFWFEANSSNNQRHLVGCNVIWEAVVGDPRNIKIGTRGFLIPALSSITKKPYRMMRVSTLGGSLYPVSHLFQPTRLKLRTR